MRPLSWFLLGFTLMLIVGVATAGYSPGDGQCYSTRSAAIEAFYRRMPIIEAASSSAAYVTSLGSTCMDIGSYIDCPLKNGAGTYIGTYRLYLSSCLENESDIPFNKYWLAPVVVVLFFMGWRLGMQR